MEAQFLGKQRFHFSQIASTNDWLSNLSKLSALPNGLAVTADFQRIGKGIMGTTWQAEPSKNLLVSLFLRPEDLLVSEQFALNKAVAIGIVEFLKELGFEASIKWPNDILIKSQKICGVLIQNIIMGSYIKSVVLGIGLNVNQENFENDLKNPTSLHILTSRTHNLEHIFKALMGHLEYWLSRISDIDQINRSYLTKMFKLEEWADYEINQQVVRAKIIGVDPYGRLQLEDESGITLNLGLKEVVYL